MNLKEILNEVLSQSSFLKRDSFAGSVDPDDQQMVSIANATADNIRTFYPWMKLRTSLDIEFQEGQYRYALPNDFDGFVPNSVWEANGSKPVDIPLSDRQWYKFKFSSAGSGGMIRARLYDNAIEIAELNPGQTISLEYISKWIIQSSASEGKERFTSDTDTFRLDDQMLILGIKADWADTKEFAQADKWKGQFWNKLTREIGKTTGSSTIGGYPKSYGNGSPYYPLYRT